MMPTNPRPPRAGAIGRIMRRLVYSLVVCAVILFLSWLVIGWIAPTTGRDAVQVGVLWLALTLAFEFGFGHPVARKPWRALLADYNVTAGRVWLLVLVTTLFAPLVMGRAREVW